MFTNSRSVMEDLESLEDILDDYEYDESDESDESDLTERRRRGRRWNRPQTATGGRLYQPRPMSKYVTQTQLQTALARVGSEIKTNSVAVETVNTRINTVSAEQTRQATVLKKEVSDRKKQDETLKRDVRQKLELLTLLPALTRPPSKEITINEEKVKVLVDSNDNLSLLLPLLLVGGLGGSGGIGGSGGDNNDSNMLLLVLALSGGLGGRS